jgi:hypothetical protein
LSEEAVRAIFEHWAKKTIAARGCQHVKVICFDEITLHKGNSKYILVISVPELGLAQTSSPWPSPPPVPAPGAGRAGSAEN